MVLSRVQLVAGASNTGVPVLSGQVQGVLAGSGVIIDTVTGALSVDPASSVFNDFIRTNNPIAFNTYRWPDSQGTAGQFLKEVDGTGILEWSDVSGYAVATVSPIQPGSPDEGELWYDCGTGTLKIFQNCVSPGGWTAVTEPGLPVDPTLTSASPAFASGDGTQGNPYIVTLTTTGSGTSFVVNRVTVTGLASNQYVPITDLNSVTNENRFSFSNHYADGSGTLIFDVIFTDLPPSTSGSSFTAAIRVGYASAYIEAQVDITLSFAITSPGSISGAPQVGQTLTYTLGTYTGGLAPVNESWVWKDSAGNTLASNTPTYVVTSAEAGRNIFVEYSVVDSSAPPVTLTANTTSTSPVFEITSPGSVSGVPAVGQILTYTAGTYVGGLAPVLATWQWKDSAGNVLASNTPTYTVTAAEANRSIFVEYTVSDASTPTQTLSDVTPSTSPVLAITSPGSIAGVANVGQTLTYTQGTYSGGLAPVVETWDWKDSSGTILASNTPTYVITASEAGKTIYVEYKVTDSSVPPVILSANTASTATVTFVPFPPGTWNPGPANGLDASPGLISGPYNGTSSTITPTGCIEVSTDGTNFVKSPATLPIVGGTDTLYARWVTTPAGTCGESPTVTSISGAVSDGTFINPYSLSVSRIPNPAIGNLTDGPVPLIATVTKATSTTIQGLTATAYVTYVGTSTGTSISASTDNINFTPLATSGQGFPVVNGQTLYIRQTVGSTISTGYTAIIRVGDGTNTASTYGEFTYTATTTNTATFPNVSISPSTGPNASPAGISIPAETLNGTASGTWPASPSAETTNPFPVTSTGALLFSQNGNPAGQGPSSFVLNDTIDLVWDEAVVDATADGGSVSGDLVGAPYANSYSMTIDRTPDTFTLATLSGEPVSSQVDSETVNITGINVPTFLTYTSGSPDSLTNPFVSINNGPQVAIPASGNTLKIPPGATLEFFADTGTTAPTTYTITFNMGSLSVPWSVQTAAGAGVVQPSITAPANNATGINPTSVSPYGVTLTGSAYATTGGAGGHTSSSWKLYSAIPYQPETTGTISNVQVVGPATTNPMANWTGGESVPIPLSTAPTNFYSVAGGSSGWIIGTFNSSSLYSAMRATDGVNWISTNSPFVANIPGPRSLAFGNGRFVAGGVGRFSHSDDGGMLWTEQAAITPNPGNIDWVRFGGGQFVAYGATTTRSYTSPDGITWTARNLIVASMKDAYYANSLWVSVGGTGTTSHIYTSPDGQTWTAQTAGVAQALTGITYGNGLWVAVGNNNTILTSPDASVWTPRTSPAAATDDFTGVAFGDGYFVAVGFGGLLSYSLDGVTWVLIPTAVNKLNSTAGVPGVIAYADGMFVAAQSLGFNITSSVASYVTLTFTSNVGFSEFAVGDPVIESPGTAKGTIKAIRSAGNEIDIQLSSGTWGNGNKMKLAPTGKLKVPPAPTSGSPDPTLYTQVVNVAGDTSNLTSYFVSVANLSPNKTYYAQVSYTSADPLTSPPSAWSKFSTSLTFASNATPGFLSSMSGNVVGPALATYSPSNTSLGPTPVTYAFSDPVTNKYTGFVEDLTGAIVADGSAVFAAGISSDLSQPFRPKVSDAALVTLSSSDEYLVLNATSGFPSIGNNLSSTYRLTLSPGVNVLRTGISAYASPTPPFWVTLTNGDLYFWGTGTIGSPSPAGTTWRQVPYTFPAGQKITKVVALGTTSAKVVALTDTGNLYVVGTNGATSDFGFPDTGTWTSPTQITGISNVLDINWFPNGRGISAVTSSGDLWVGATASANFATTDITFQVVGSGFITPLWGVSTGTNFSRLYALKTDGLVYTKNTAFVGGGADIFTQVTYNPANAPLFNKGILGDDFQGTSLTSPMILP